MTSSAQSSQLSSEVSGPVAATARTAASTKRSISSPPLAFQKPFFQCTAEIAFSITTANRERGERRRQAEREEQALALGILLLLAAVRRHGAGRDGRRLRRSAPRRLGTPFS